MAPKLDGADTGTRQWVLSTLGVAICLLLIGLLMDRLFINPTYGGAGREREGETMEPAPLGAMYAPVTGTSQDEPTVTGLSTRPDAGGAAATTAGEIELDFQLVAGAVDDPGAADDPAVTAGSPPEDNGVDTELRGDDPASGQFGSTRVRDAGIEPESDGVPGALDAGTRQASPEAANEEPTLEEPRPEPCGMTYCPVGLVCCNASCGTCTLPGHSCSQLTCSMLTVPFSVTCGQNTCSVNEVCCNPSCGICAAPGEPCSQRLCD